MLFSTEIWLALITLTTLEIVLGVDNLVFISIAVSRLPEEKREVARKFGLALASITRIGLLFTITWFARMEAPIFTLMDVELSVRDLVLIGGGLFLLVKGTMEIHETVEGGDQQNTVGRAPAAFSMVILQIAIIDIVFSLDSVITAVGLVDQVWIMVVAILIAVAIMILAATVVGEFIERHPTIKMLALAFLILVGMALIADGMDFHIPRGYLYFAMAFSGGVEALNLAAHKRRNRRASDAAKKP